MKEIYPLISVIILDYLDELSAVRRILIKRRLIDQKRKYVAMEREDQSQRALKMLHS